MTFAEHGKGSRIMVSKPTLSAVFLLFLFFASPAWLVAQNLNVDNILIRKVTRIDPTGNTQDRKVNILISDRKLELISEDKIFRDEAQQVLSADGGFILGKLEIGEPPNFMILSEDPRKNFKVLLDTKTHAVFAMHNGQVVRNRLQVVGDDTAEDEPARSG